MTMRGESPDRAQLLRAEYERRYPGLEELQGEAEFVLRHAIRLRGLRIHSVTSRIKDVESFLDKVSRKDYASPFEQTVDLVGLRVICVFLAHLEEIRDIIQSHFDVLSEDDKVEGQAPSLFEYMAVHYVVRMKESYSGPRYEAIKSFPFEIQARTILMDGWANVSHHLDYKGGSSIPSELQRDFHALSGLLYTADKHFELFFRRTEESRRRAEESIVVRGEPDYSQEINTDTLLAYLQKKFPDRPHRPGKVVADLAIELTAWGHSHLSDLDRILQRSSRALKEFEKDQPPGKGKLFTDVGAVRASLALVNDEYSKRVYGSIKSPGYRQFLDPASEGGSMNA
jgi:putative GTP pyrophosphokinase